MRTVARHQLLEVVGVRFGCESPAEEDSIQFLNDTAAESERGCRDVKSLWSDIRKSLKKMNLTVQLVNDSFMMIVDNVQDLVIGRKGLNSFLKERMTLRGLCRPGEMFFAYQ